MEQEEWERLDISQVFYMVKNYLLIELDLGNWYVVRQWKDLDVEYKDGDNGKFKMKYWMLYCTRWNNIESVWNWRWQEELEEWIKTCQNYI